MSNPKQHRLTDFFKSKEGQTRTEPKQVPVEVPSSSCENEKPNALAEKVGPKREILPKWLKDYSWLRFDNSKMTCMGEGKDNPFTIGCTNFRHSTLVRHASSNQHRAALEAQSLRRNLSKQTESIISTKNEAAIGALRSVYWLAKEQMPTSKHRSLLNLQKLQGCNFVDDLQVGSSATYTSHTAAEDMQDAIASVLRDSTDASLKASPFISILLDESCDISVTKKLLLYARTISSAFDIDSHFVSNVSLTDGTAKTIYQSLKNTLASRGVEMDHVLVVGSDGASVMTGSKNGVVALIKHESPFVLGVHCSTHKLALCSSQAAEKVPYLKKYQQILSDVFYHFKRSALRREKLREIQSVLEDPHIQYKELHSVRWFSMYSALEAISRTWTSLATYMESRVESSNDTVAKGFLKKIATFVFIACTHLLMDIIPKVTQLSLFFQKENIDIAMLRPSVDSVVQQLQWLKTNDGPYLTEFMKEAGEKLEMFKGVKVLDTPGQRQQFHKTRELFISNLISEMTRRFPAVATDIISNMAILSLRGLSLLYAEERKDYGMSQINTLVQHYGQKMGDAEPLIDGEETLTEWAQCKDLVVQQHYPCNTVAST